MFSETRGIITWGVTRRDITLNSSPKIGIIVCVNLKQEKPIKSVNLIRVLVNLFY